MLDQEVKDYSAYLKIDISSSFQTVQDVIDNMLTRLEELCSVINLVKLKNGECCSSVSEDISNYRAEITILSKKINTLNQVLLKLSNNMDLVEKQVEKAEMDFSVNNDNKIRSFLKPFLMRTRETVTLDNTPARLEKLNLESVMGSFVEE